MSHNLNAKSHITNTKGHNTNAKVIYKFINPLLHSCCGFCICLDPAGHRRSGPCSVCIPKVTGKNTGNCGCKNLYSILPSVLHIRGVSVFSWTVNPYDGDDFPMHVQKLLTPTISKSEFTSHPSTSSPRFP